MYNIYRYIKSILYNIIVYGEMRMKKKFIIPLSVAAMTLVSVTAVSAAQEPAVQPQYGVVSDYEMVGAS